MGHFEHEVKGAASPWPIVARSGEADFKRVILTKHTSENCYCVFNKTSQSFLGLNVVCAATSFTRLKGLIGKRRLGSGEGLWIIPSNGVHTIGMLFPIDVVYLDHRNRVIHVIEYLGPFRIGPIRMNCSSVLELPARTIYCSQTSVGHELLVCSPEEMERYLKEGTFEENRKMSAGRNASE